MPTMNLAVFGLPLTGAIFVTMLCLLEIGRRIGRRRLAREQAAAAGFGVVDSAVFALMGLLVAFTFSGAAARFDGRRELVVQEANAIGTAYLRLDLLAPPARAKLQEDFRRYVDARLVVYRDVTDVAATRARLADVAVLQRAIWDAAVAASAQAPTAHAAILLLPALNAMIDIATTRSMAAWMHPPAVIFVMLVVLALAGALLAGHAMAGTTRGSTLHMLLFAAVVSATIYVIIDLEYPRLGLIRVDAMDRVLIDLRSSMR
jgi:hypothetical protein